MMRRMIRNLCDNCKDCEDNDKTIGYCYTVCGRPFDILRNIEKERNDKADKIASDKDVLEQTEWIPVSERLPEEKGYYLTTTMYHEVYCDYWDENFNRTEEVIAWMPLPKPYKAGE